MIKKTVKRNVQDMADKRLAVMLMQGLAFTKEFQKCDLWGLQRTAISCLGRRGQVRETGREPAVYRGTFSLHP